MEDHGRVQLQDIDRAAFARCKVVHLALMVIDMSLGIALLGGWQGAVHHDEKQVPMLPFLVMLIGAWSEAADAAAGDASISPAKSAKRCAQAVVGVILGVIGMFILAGVSRRN